MRESPHRAAPGATRKSAAARPALKADHVALLAVDFFEKRNQQNAHFGQGSADRMGKRGYGVLQVLFQIFLGDGRHQEIRKHRAERNHFGPDTGSNSSTVTFVRSVSMGIGSIDCNRSEAFVPFYHRNENVEQAFSRHVLVIRKRAADASRRSIRDTNTRTKPQGRVPFATYHHGSCFRSSLYRPRKSPVGEITERAPNERSV